MQILVTCLLVFMTVYLKTSMCAVDQPTICSPMFSVNYYRLYRKTPSSARERAVFRLAKPVPSGAEGTEAGDIGFIVDAAGCSQAENKPLEARPSFQTEPQCKF